MIASALVAQTSVCASLNLGAFDPFARADRESCFSNFVFRVSLFELFSAAEKT